MSKPTKESTPEQILQRKLFMEMGTIARTIANLENFYTVNKDELGRMNAHDIYAAILVLEEWYKYTKYRISNIPKSPPKPRAPRKSTKSI
jgi:hypothetical protein